MLAILIMLNVQSRSCTIHFKFRLTNILSDKEYVYSYTHSDSKTQWQLANNIYKHRVNKLERCKSVGKRIFDKLRPFLTKTERS